jgi:hypothetical protein
VTVLIGLSVCVLLAVKLETWYPLQQFRAAHPTVAGFIPLGGLQVPIASESHTVVNTQSIT